MKTQTKPHRYLLNNKQNAHPQSCQLPPTCSSQQSYLEYYQLQSPPSQRQIKRGKQSKGSMFFGRFDQNCSVEYQRVVFQKKLVYRQLEEELANMHKTPPKKEQSNNPEFSFKKDAAVSTANSRAVPEYTQRQEYFVQQPRCRLRKFHSLATLRGTHSQRDSSRCQGQRVQLKKNCSVVKYDLGRDRDGGKERERGKEGGKDGGKDRNNNQNNPNNNNYGNNYNNQNYSYNNDYEPDCRQGGAERRVFEEEKRRLSMIRSQLNEIYLMRRPFQLR